MFGSTPLGVQRQVGKGHGGFSGDERGSRTLRRRRLGFNLGPTSADAGPMSDVEAIRGMASNATSSSWTSTRTESTPRRARSFRVDLAPLPHGHGEA